MIKITPIDIVEQWLIDSTHSYVIQSDKKRDTPYVFIVNKISAIYIYDQYASIHRLKTKYDPVKPNFNNPEFFSILGKTIEEGIHLNSMRYQAEQISR